MRVPLFYLVLALTMALASPAPAAAQCALVPGDTTSRPDIRLFARVQASELRFESRPRADVAALGCITGDTVRILSRRNLPETIVPGETYRDVEIAVEIVTRLSVVCSNELLNLLATTSAAPRIAALCAVTDTTPRIRRNP